MTRHDIHGPRIDRRDVGAVKKPISDEDKKAIRNYYEAGLRIPKASCDLLEDLKGIYGRSTRQIERYIREEREREGASATQSPEVKHEQKSYEETAHKQKTQELAVGLEQQEPTGSPPLGELINLLHRWRKQAQFQWPDQFLREYHLEGLTEEVQRRATEVPCDATIYHAAKEHHLQQISLRFTPGRLPVKKEALFDALRRCYPADPIWEAQDSWSQAYDVYFNAFLSWCENLQDAVEPAFASALTSMDELPQEGRETEHLVEQLKKKDANWLIFLGLADLALSCDLLALGIAELAPRPLWFRHVTKLQKLRSEALNMGTRLPGILGLPGIQNAISEIAKISWERHAVVKQITRDLLDKLQRLQAAHDDLHGKLKALELRLYGVTE
jgi:hypothetical protein